MFRYRRGVIHFVLTASFAFAQAACGDEPGPESSPSATSSPAASSPATQPTTSDQPAPSSEVAVSLGASRYRSGELVQVTIANGLNRQIFTEDFHTDCSVVTLQRSGAAGWTDIEGCRMGRPTRTIGIPAGARYAVTLDPASFHVTFGAGTYRIRFTYHLQPDPMGEQVSTVYSANFTVA